MSKIFELFGYPLDRWCDEAQENCRQAHCPFMNAECDGGGNRYLSGINLKIRKDLRTYFPGKKSVQSGVCSLQLTPDEQPWIVCPRRLLSLKQEKTHYQSATVAKLVAVSNLQEQSSYRVWSEVKMKVAQDGEDGESKSFDYTFDYVLAGSTPKPLSEVASLIGKTKSQTQKIAEANGYTLAQRDGECWIENFPADPITIIEVMTSSTSGGNKDKRTQIAMAFEDAVKNGDNHNAPGINYRQVWARMVSQLIVKSQVGMAWGGRTIWILQDLLANYISKSTALNLEKYASDHPDEVNILAFGYGKKMLTDEHKGKPIELTDNRFYAGPVSETGQDGAGFIDIVKIGSVPPKQCLWLSLFHKKPSVVLHT